MVEGLPHATPSRWDAGNPSPVLRAVVATGDAELDRLQSLVRDHPEVLDPDCSVLVGRSVLTLAVRHAYRAPTENALAVLAWLAQQEGATTEHWTRALHRVEGSATIGEIQFFLDRGADPHWRPATGMTLTERAILSGWDPSAVDRVAELVAPPPSLWAAAGLNDLDGMRRFLGSPGTVLPEAHGSRPDFLMVGLRYPIRPHVSDQIVLAEAFLVAALHRRMGALSLLLMHGASPDTILLWGRSLTQLGHELGQPQLGELLQAARKHTT